MFRAFSEDERRTLAGFTYKIGKCAATASKYHGADERETIESLFSFLSTYTPNTVDHALDDVVGGFTADDYWSDAKMALEPLQQRIQSFTDIMSIVPVVGPTIM